MKNPGELWTKVNFSRMRKFYGLSIPEILALAIKVEKNNAERLKTFLNLFADYDPNLQSYLHQLYLEELEHKKILEQKWLDRFRNTPFPEIYENCIEGVIEAFDVSHGEHEIFDDLTVDQTMTIIRDMEKSAYLFYLRAAAAIDDMEIKSLLSDLARFEHSHLENIPQFNLESRR